VRYLWQYRLGAIQRLDLAFLVRAYHHGLLGRVVIETDDVDDVVQELRFGGAGEVIKQVWFKVERAPDSPDRGRVQSGAVGQ
jgi:hypothetical protein